MTTGVESAHDGRMTSWNPDEPGRGIGDGAPVWVHVATSCALIILVVVALGNAFR